MKLQCWFWARQIFNN